MSDSQLDVRAEPPARRHGLIFEAYDRLAAGSGFVLVDDHDPNKPLYYQFAAEHPDQFTWDYLEQGPEIWRVRIGRGLSAAATRVRAPAVVTLTSWLQCLDDDPLMAGAPTAADEGVRSDARVSPRGRERTRR
jgi:uncharacterized protein (DUF2249 family)